ncbi:MAG TPA: matrixin family metalloprotease [Bryobacteraceae bacterium]
MPIKPWLTMALFFACSAYGVDLRYWIEPCTRPETGCQKADVQLAEWAMQAWQTAAEGKLHLERTEQMSRANIRVYWADSESGKYGETRAFLTETMRGAEVYVLPDLRAMGPDIFAAGSQDVLFRETIVYLTCLHETGHALGLAHTADFPDIMYSFQFGGDIPEYFGRYRRKLQARTDIAKNSGISPQDKLRLFQALK